MLHQRRAALIACSLLPLLGGCVQSTRHSNTMIFGTNTTVGLKVGRDVHQMPNILIAYDRQEAVIMPLLANTAEKAGAQNMLSPCSPDALASEEEVAHPCKFVGIRKGKDELEIQDSYSVLASFGARIEGDASTTKGTVGLAQYFATGVAAQTLALSGGAAIISVGDAATAAAGTASNAANASAALGATPVVSASGQAFESSWGTLITQVGSEQDGAKRASLVDAAVDRAGIGDGPAGRIKGECQVMKTSQDCLKKLAESAALFNTPRFFN